MVSPCIFTPNSMWNSNMYDYKWSVEYFCIKILSSDMGINNFKDLDRDFIKRINIPCEMTGKEIIEEIEI